MFSVCPLFLFPRLPVELFKHFIGLHVDLLIEFLSILLHIIFLVVALLQYTYLTYHNLLHFTI